MDFLHNNNQIIAGENNGNEEFSTKGKKVLVLGGGDTGSDCIGTSIRNGAKEVIQVTIEEQPPKERTDQNPWPEWPRIMKTSSSHQEGCTRIWGLNATAFNSNEGGELVSCQF